MGSVHAFPQRDPNDAAVGARLRRWREDRGYAVEQLADALGLSLEDFHRAEAGRRHLTALELAAATARLHLPVWALASDERAY